MVNRITIASFAAVLWLCMAGTWLGWGAVDGERRVLAPAPVLGRTFPDQLGMYVRDHYGFRGILTRWNAFLRVRVLGSSTTPEVIVGKGGFLFYGGDGALENFTGGSAGNVEAWVAAFEKRSAWLAQRGIPLVVMVAPDKESIYPEMMPVKRSPRASALERFVRAMPAGIRVIDVRSELRAHKGDHLMYYKTDSHWSPWGGYRAFRQMMPAAEVEVRSGRAEQASDLPRLLGFEAEVEVAESVVPVAGLKRLEGEQDGPLMVSESAGAGPRLVFFRDSFGAALMPFLGTQFSRIYAPNGWAFDGGTVLRERPDRVMIELVERRLNAPPPVDFFPVR